MRLRSRNILNENPTTPCRRRRAAPETPEPQTPLLQTQVSLSVLNTTYEKQTNLLCVFGVIERVIPYCEWSAQALLAWC